MAKLTPRQAEVAGLVARGVAVKQIARKLDPPVTEFAVRRAIERLAAKCPGEGKPLYRVANLPLHPTE